MARAVEDIDGLLLIHIPVSVLPEIPRKIVHAANRRRTRDDGTPYSILVTRDGSVDKTNNDEISIAEAIRYRQGDRLVVLHADSADLESFSGVYRTVIGPEFPDESQRAVTELADTAAGLLIPKSSISERGKQAVAGELRYAMMLAMAVLKHSSDPQGNWVARWYQMTAEAFDRIFQEIEELEESADPVSPTKVAEMLILPSFGLPQSKRTDNAREIEMTGKKVAKALETHWSSGDDAWTSDAQIQEGANSPFKSRRSDWDNFDLAVAEGGSVYRALQEQLLNPTERNFEKFQTLTLGDFCSPDSRPEVEIQILDESGESVAVTDGQNVWNILKTHIGSDGKTTESERVELIVPLRGSLLETDLQIITPSLNFTGEKILDGNHIRLSGYFTWSQIAQRRRAMKYPLTLQTEEIGDVATALGNPLTKLIALPPDVPSIIAFENDKKGNARAKLLFLPSDATDFQNVATDTQNDESLAVNNGATYSVIAHALSDAEPTIDGRQFTESRPGIFVKKKTVTAQSDISVDDVQFQLYVADDGDEEFSPILAAARRSPVSGESLEASEVSNDVRQVFEEHLLDCTLNDTRLPGTGHVFTSELDTNDRTATQATFIERDGYTEFGARNRSQFESLRLEHEITSPEYLVATSSFMDAAEKVLKTIYPDGGTQLTISRISQSNLWTKNRSTLDDYLHAYINLVEVGKRISGEDYRMATFLASFPFSISVWEGAECKSVLLSPLHPIRLAWLASTEDLLSRASEDLASDFLGILEGWQFPYLVAGHTSETTFIAVPTTAGYQDLFLGWSMLTALPYGSTRQIEPPSNVFGFRPPDTATSGLTGSAVSSSLRDFIKVNPFITNLSVDLAAETETRRIADIDRAVINFYKANASESQYGLQGLEVFDSVHRRGTLPSKEILAAPHSGEGGRMTWNRYGPKDTPHAMVRIQQDAIMRISATNRQNKSPTGLTSSRLTRRFISESGYLKEKSLHLHPTLAISEGAENSAIQALQAVESTFGGSLQLRPNQQSHAGNRAWWTISGEALAFPNAIQTLLPGAGGNSSTIWEWRPPFFDNTDSSTDLANRAYLILARIPTPLRDRIDQRITRIPHSDMMFSSQDVFKTLGAQGIGLASLLSIGGHQASGAIGFYLALTLCAALESENRKRLVLPIDACQRFLDLLSGDRPDASKHRADLLLFDIGIDSIRLVPVEVKMAGLDKENYSSMPGPRSPEVLEALDQAGRSRSQLQDMLKYREDNASIENANHSADSLLWNTAFASLVETAIKLGMPDDGPQESSILSNALRSILQGNCHLKVDEGMALIFSNTGTSDLWLNDVDQKSRIQVERLTPGAVFNKDLLNDWISRFNQRTGDQSLPKSSEISQNVPSNILHTTPNRTDSPSVIAAKADSDSIQREQAESEVSDPSVSQRKESEELLRDTDLPEKTTAPTSLQAPGIRFTIGNFTDTYGSQKAELWLGNTRLNQLNIGVVGDLGTGKTQLVKALIYQIRKRSSETQSKPVDFIIFDYKRDYGDQEFLESVGGKRISPHFIPLNLFDLGENPTPFEQTLRIGSFIDVLEKIYSGIGPKQKRYLTGVIRDLYRESPDSPPTISRILDRYEDEHGIDSVSAILGPFVDFQVFDENPENTMSFKDLIDGKVLVVDLNKLGTNTDIKNSVVTLLLNLYYEYMKELPKHPYLTAGEDQIRNVTSYVVVDEATHILKYEFPVLEQLLLEGREFGVGVLLSTQFLSHFSTKSKNWAEPLLTWFIHKVPMVTPRELTAIGTEGTQEKANKISNLDPHYALYSSLDVRGDFILGIPYYRLITDE